ncbi:hypothetical protein [Bifidobacterium actinocoloniiforme]|nr:hypothetical protein [Bifidobacterium actinocoloniiforme]AKV55988.1 hypothetical protein AB656_07410 [Bifidobacterium actinocoloniiforme DSM 22766]
MGMAMILVVLAVLAPHSHATPTSQGDDLAAVPVDPKPRLYKMLAYNNRIDTLNDELRMDFVLRVQHGQVDTNCVPAGTSDLGDRCGLSFLYSYSSVGDRPAQYYRSTYLNTQGKTGATRWATNIDSYFTIHNVLSSGNYDYLTISLEADIGYPDSNVSPDYDAAAKEKVSYKQPGGAKLNQYVYAIAGKGTAHWELGNAPFMDARTKLDPRYATNITADFPAYVYTPYCLAGSIGGACNGPMSFIGWDANPLLWSGGQANWGMVTDHGFSGRSEPAGVAPAKSFFVYWYNPAYGMISNGMPFPCSVNTSFYYQWIGLKDGSEWVPVSALTPNRQLAKGQKAVGPGVPPPGLNEGAAYNAPKSGYNLIAPGPSDGSESAQRPDGSIDFAKAKLADGLDGYFKLVTWPVTTNANGSTDGCVTDINRDAYNPEAGISAGMDQAMIAERIDKGWTVGTAFYRYELPKPSRPVIDAPADGSYQDGLTPSISGSGSPGQRVTLFAEDATHPIAAADSDSKASRGFELGSAIVGPDGRWTVHDANGTPEPNKPGGSRRYHAWQTELQSGYELTSDFSNILSLNFLAGEDPAPSVKSVSVPHSLGGALPDGAAVKVVGAVNPVNPGGELTLYARPTDRGASGAGGTGAARGSGASGDATGAGSKATASGASARAAAVPRAIPSSGVGSASTVVPTEAAAPAGALPDEGLVYKRSDLPVGPMDWQAQVDPQLFLDVRPADGRGLYYDFVVVLTNKAGKQISSTSWTQLVDMEAPDPGVSGVRAGNLNGRAVSGRDRIGEEGVSIRVSWPDGTSATSTSGPDGAWSLPLPASASSGQASASAVDAAGNESAPQDFQLDDATNVGTLPLAGGHGWMVYVGLLLAFMGAMGVRGLLQRRAGVR